MKIKPVHIFLLFWIGCILWASGFSSCGEAPTESPEALLAPSSSGYYYVSDLRDTIQGDSLGGSAGKDTFEIDNTFLVPGIFTWEILQDTLVDTIGGKVYFEYLVNRYSTNWKKADSLSLSPGDKAYASISYTDLATGAGGVEAYENIVRTRARWAATGDSTETIFDVRFSFKSLR